MDPHQRKLYHSKTLINDLIRLTRVISIFSRYSRRNELNPSICRKYNWETLGFLNNMGYIQTTLASRSPGSL